MRYSGGKSPSTCKSRGRFQPLSNPEKHIHMPDRSTLIGTAQHLTRYVSQAAEMQVMDDYNGPWGSV